MASLRVGIIGCGKSRNSPGFTGFGMAHSHANGFAALPDCELVALADTVEANAIAFQEEHGGDAIYTDYHEMLKKEKLDIVSIATWPHLHAPMVIAAAEAGVKAIHCEKPVATNYGDAKKMVEVAEKHGVQLTFNHQRRFNAPFMKAKQLLDSGVIGELRRLEGACGNLYDWGTHWFDMMFYYNDETPVEWVIGQVDLRDGQTWFGFTVEGQGISQFKFANGVRGLLVSGADTGWGASNRLLGTDGIIEVNPDAEDVNLRYMGKDAAGWQNVECGESIHAPDSISVGIADLVDALKTGREPMLSARRALRATELIFATYESSRRRARIDLPLTVDDNALLAMQEAAKV